MMTIEQVQAFLYREARLLDDRQWDEWLACYHRPRNSGCRRGTTTTS